jgi:ubiquinone/menaquinone biosynthesis C-methylase UbiE
VRLTDAGEALACPCCATRYPRHAAGVVDLVPRTALGAVTQYADHEFHERLHVTDAPPVLSAGVKADMAQALLHLRPGEALVDLGCGAGKLALAAADAGAAVTGLDIAPFFLARTLERVELVLGDLRRLPFRKGAYPAAYSLDVLEHLDEEGVFELLREARRTLAPAGRLAVYTHAMESSRLAGFQRATNRLARRLGERGLVDHEREALRKSDHLNAIRSHEHFETLAARAGLRVAERRYYNVVFKAVVEDLLLRLYEQGRRRRAAGAAAPAHPAGATPAAHESGPAVAAMATARADHGASPVRVVGGATPGRGALALAHGLTWLLKWDVVLFGGVRTGPFFARLEPLARGELR